VKENIKKSVFGQLNLINPLLVAVENNILHPFHT